MPRREWSNVEDDGLFHRVRHEIQAGNDIHWTRMGDELPRPEGMLPRTGEACRKRWMSNLNPIRCFTKMENNRIISAYREQPEEWVTITAGLSYRMGEEQLVENHFNSNLRQQFEREVGNEGHARKRPRMDVGSSNGVGSLSGDKKVQNDEESSSAVEGSGEENIGVLVDSWVVTPRQSPDKDDKKED